MALDASPPAPPVPPRPRSSASYHYDESLVSPAVPPPIPPLPPGFRAYKEDIHRPRSVDQFLAPRPLPPVQDLHSEMLHSFNDQIGVSFNGVARFASPAPLPYVRQQGIISPAPRFTSPDVTPYCGSYAFPVLSPPPLPPPLSLPADAIWRGGPSVDIGSVAALMSTASLDDSSLPRIRSVHGIVEHPPPRPPLPLPPLSGSPRGHRLAAPLPSIATLEGALLSVQSPNTDESSRVAWIRDVLFLVKRNGIAAGDSATFSSGLVLTSRSLPSGRIKIIDPALQDLAGNAVSLLLALMPTLPGRHQKLSPPEAEALYIRAELTSSGTFPDSIPASPRNAFREFEAAARAGFSPAWFRLGRDYESFDDTAHAQQCFDRGVNEGDVGCIYRMGMAHLLGQLSFPANSADDVELGVRLLHQAATSATVEFPHPPFVFALFLLDEFKQISIPYDVLVAYIPAGSTPALEARRHLERAAFLHFTPAQQRLGRAYEFAEAPFSFDPLLSLEYYCLASAGGDAQADLGLSKWYLCGAEGAFGKDELRARECAERGAARGFPAAKFAMGYYCEVGIGAPPDIQRARQWYGEAAALGEVEAMGRLDALVDAAVPLSREQHDTLARNKLVRSRTQARIRSDATAREDGALSSQAPVPQYREYVVPQRRQASLPAFMPSYNSLPVPHAQHQPLPRHATTLPLQPPYGHPNDASYESYLSVSGQDQQFSDQPRYSLVDPGVVHSPGNVPVPLASARRVASTGATLPPMRRQHNGQTTISSSRSPHTSPRAAVSALPSEAESTTNTAPNTGARKYTTFAEMGIEGKRAEEKECVIM